LHLFNAAGTIGLIDLLLQLLKTARTVQLVDLLIHFGDATRAIETVDIPPHLFNPPDPVRAIHQRLEFALLSQWIHPSNCRALCSRDDC
jgi:hypothetical protein